MRSRYLIGVFALAAFLGGCTFSLAEDVTPPPNSELSAAPATVEPVMPSSPPDVSRGEVLYAQKCAPCHGIGGLGDGEQSVNLPVAVPAIGTAELARQNPPMQWFLIVSEGNMDNFMPPFAGSLDTQQRWDVLAYVYSLSGELALDDAGNLVETEVSLVTGTANNVQPVTVDALGKVENGSGGDLPTGAPVTLYSFHSQDEVTRTTTLGSDGVFRFDAIPADARNLYQVSIEYKGLIYFSDPLTEMDLQTGKQFELTVYEGTQDTSKLDISSLNLVFDFVEEDQVKVIEQVLLSNSGDLTIVPAQEGQALLRYELPPDAVDVSFEQGEVGDRYEFVSGGFVDYRAVLPGQDTYQVLYAFDLNYDHALEFVRSVEFPAHNIHVFLPESQIQLEGENLVLVGEQLIGEVPYRVYLLERDLEPGEQITLRLTGAHPLNQPFLIQISANNFFIGLIAFSVTVGVVAYWLRRKPGATSTTGSSSQIMDAIIALDEQFERKQIPESQYKRERARLKNRLSFALKKESKL